MNIRYELLWNLCDTVGKNKNRKKVKLIHSTANVRSIIIFFFFLWNLWSLFFIAIIRSIILYKVNTYTKHVRLSYILFFFFLSSSVTSFYLFAPSSYFFSSLSHIHTRSLSFSRFSQSLFHSLFSFCSRIYTTHTYSPFCLSFFFSSHVCSRTSKPETRRKLYARHASASTNRSWVPTLRRVCHSWQNSSS